MTQDDLQAAIQNRSMIPYWYATPIISSLANSASASSNIQFDADAKFKWLKTTFFCDLASAAMVDGTRPIPLITVNLTDTGCGRNFVSTAVPLDSIAGYKASEPYILPIPMLFSPNATLRVTFANYSSATTYNNLYMVFHGVKIYN
jgi:hypothetical protein